MTLRKRRKFEPLLGQLSENEQPLLMLRLLVFRYDDLAHESDDTLEPGVRVRYERKNFSYDEVTCMLCRAGMCVQRILIDPKLDGDVHVHGVMLH